MAELYLNKAILEARYDKALLFNDLNKLQSIKRQINSEFPVGDYDKINNALILRNDTKRCVVSISENRFGIDMDEPKSLENFKNLANDVMEVVINLLDIISFTRIGFRTWRGIEVDSLEKANNYIKKNFIKIDDNALNELGSNIRDYTVAFNFNVNDYVVTLNIHPQIFQFMHIVDGNVVSSTNKQHVLIDTDVFKNGILDTKQIHSSFIREAIKINNERVGQFIKSIGV